MQNLQVIKEVCNDIGLEIDSTQTELNRFKLRDRKTLSRLDEMEDMLGAMAAKLESKLFESLPGVRVGADLDQTHGRGPPQAQIRAEPLAAPRGTVGVETHIDLLKRIQKLELATNRLLADAGRVGEGYKQTMPTTAENALALRQQEMVMELQ